MPLSESTTIASRLAAAIAGGVRRIGEIEIRPWGGSGATLRHAADADRDDGLEVCDGPAEARRLSLYDENGGYRFLKARRDLRRGWLLRVGSAEDLRLALDHFYPAATGLWTAWLDGRLEPETLRAKLDRQSGMYRRARNTTDASAAGLVASVCGAGPVCARLILWRISDAAPPVESPAGGVGGDDAIPLLCAFPCNHFIAECLTASKQPAASP